MTLSNDIIEVLENNDWRLCGEVKKQGKEFYVEIKNFSPCGEDIIEIVWFDGTDAGFIDGVKKCALNFDADDHAEMWVDQRGKNGVPDSIRELINDANAIQKMLDDLVAELNKLCMEKTEVTA